MNELIFVIWIMADASRTGPLVEYERRISDGELMTGDICQVRSKASLFYFIEQLVFVLLAAKGLCFEMLQIGALRELQRLHDELVESVDTCRLDRYNTSDKSSRLILHLEPFTSLLGLRI